MNKSLDLNDIVLLVQAIEHHKGKHLKATLIGLEKLNKLDPASRKVVLDGFNNFARQVLRLLDYNVEN